MCVLEQDLASQTADSSHGPWPATTLLPDTGDATTGGASLTEIAHLGDRTTPLTHSGT